MSVETPSATAPSQQKLPDGWRQVPLASVAEVRFSGVDKLSRPSEEPIRLCNYTDVYNNDYITGDLDFMRATATQAEINRFGLQLGDVIITKDSETPDDIGIAAAVDYTAPDLLCGYHLALIRLRTEGVDPIFLAKQMRHDRLARYFGQQANGLTRYGLPTAAVAKAPLWLPELGMQRAIGALLRLADEAIAKTEAVIAKLKQVRAGFLHDLLTRGLDEHGHLRDPIAHPEQFQDSPLGLIPKERRVEPLGFRLQQNSGFVQTGPFGSQLHAREYTNEGVPVIMPQDISAGRFTDENIARIPEAKANELRRHRAEIGDLIFARRGDLGRCAAITEHEVGWLCGTGCLLMRFEQRSLIPEWLSIAYRHDVAQRQIAARAVGTTMVNLNTQLLANLALAFPERHEQEAVARHLQEADAVIRSQMHHLSKVALLKSGLMADLLTGRVRIPEVVA